jgi:oligoribonuclease (3'-5' exoribonuclease)
MPDAAAFLHYRQFDTNTLYYFFDHKKEKVDRPHRGLDDLRQDIEFVKSKLL